MISARTIAVAVAVAVAKNMHEIERMFYGWRPVPIFYAGMFYGILLMWLFPKYTLGMLLIGGISLAIKMACLLALRDI